jgi:hypothetical protein
LPGFGLDALELAPLKVLDAHPFPVGPRDPGLLEIEDGLQPAVVPFLVLVIEMGDQPEPDVDVGDAAVEIEQVGMIRVDQVPGPLKPGLSS